MVPLKYATINLIVFVEPDIDFLMYILMVPLPADTIRINTFATLNVSSLEKLVNTYRPYYL